MKALVYDDYCDLQGMRLADIPDPAPGPDEVLVEVHAAGINPIDWKVRAGHMRARFELEFPDVAGRDRGRGALGQVGRPSSPGTSHVRKGQAPLRRRVSPSSP